ncbi:hypothetical protein M3J09_008754 [Ascochyta lentis]
MCKLTILHYSQCNCGPRDGSYGDGFIVTKGWYNRLPLDLEAVPFQRCVEAKNFALCSSRSNTMEFPRCHDVQVKALQFQGEPCFRCFTRREILLRTEKIKALNEQRKILTERFDASQRAETQDADFTRTMRHTIKTSPRFDKRTEKQIFHGTKAELSSVKFRSVEGKVPDWEDALHKQLACRKSAQERSIEKKAENASSEEKEQEEKKKQAKLALLQHRLARVNLRAASVPGEDKPLPRLRVSRPVRNTSPKTGATLDVMVPVDFVQNAHEESLAQSASTPSESSSTKTVSKKAQGKRLPENTSVKYHTINGAMATSPKPWIEDEKTGANPFPIKESGRCHMVAAVEAPEFKPFQRPPPTEPRLMRAPNAPRAMREGAVEQATWQLPQRYPTYRGHAAHRTWRG